MADYMAERNRGFAAGLATAMADGGVSIPYVFLKHYHKLNISDADAMLLIQLIAFRDKEEKALPTIEEIQERMSSEGDAVVRMLQRLMKQKLLDIVESVDPISGMQVERYSFTPLWMKLSELLSQEEMQGDAGIGSQAGGYGKTKAQEADRQEDNLFYIFEQEFGRPLSPMEIDTINGWLDQDGYPEPLILAALKEAVFSGNVKFRYVDRILLDWSRNNIKTVEQAREYTKQFRGVR